MYGSSVSGPGCSSSVSETVVVVDVAVAADDVGGVDCRHSAPPRERS